MAATAERVTITDAATLIVSEGRYVSLKNTGANTVDLGGPDVASGRRVRADGRRGGRV
jgi:hypothetical protein